MTTVCYVVHIGYMAGSMQYCWCVCWGVHVRHGLLLLWRCVSQCIYCYC